MRVTQGLLWFLIALSLPVLAFAQPKHPVAARQPPSVRPAWLPLPAPASAVERDVLAYEQNGFVILKIGTAAPVRLDTGRSPAISPRGDLLAFGTDTRIGVKLVDLTDPGMHTRFLPSFTRIAEIFFSPDGAKLACRSDTRVDIVDPKPGVAWPQSIVSGLAPEQTLQGFSTDGASIAIAGPEIVTWYGLDGHVLRQEPIPAIPGTPPDQTASPRQSLPCPTNPQLRLVDRAGTLFLFDTASGASFRLTPPTVQASQAVWASDGRHIYYTGKPAGVDDGVSKIYRSNADGTGLTELDTGHTPSVGTRP